MFIPTHLSFQRVRLGRFFKQFLSGVHSSPGSAQARSVSPLIAHSGSSSSPKILCDRDCRITPCIFNLHTNACDLADSNDSRIVHKLNK